MAEFCATCTPVTFEGIPEDHNDLVGWLDGAGCDMAWGLCEGCGHHIFDNAGKRLCGERGGVELESCSLCDDEVAP